METVVTFLVALVISLFIVYGAYGLMGLAARCILWVVHRLCQVIRKNPNLLQHACDPPRRDRCRDGRRGRDASALIARSDLRKTSA